MKITKIMKPDAKTLNHLFLNIRESCQWDYHEISVSGKRKSFRSKRGLRKISANFSFLVKPYVIKAPENVSAVAGDEIDLACVVGGRPKPELQWIRQSGDIPPNRAIVRENSVLNLRNVSPDDQDTYICRADNPAGSVEVKASLQVHCNYILMTLVAPFFPWDI